MYTHNVKAYVFIILLAEYTSKKIDDDENLTSTKYLYCMLRDGNFL